MMSNEQMIKDVKALENIEARRAWVSNLLLKTEKEKKELTDALENNALNKFRLKEEEKKIRYDLNYLEKGIGLMMHLLSLYDK